MNGKQNFLNVKELYIRRANFIPSKKRIQISQNNLNNNSKSRLDRGINITSISKIDLSRSIPVSKTPDNAQ